MIGCVNFSPISGTRLLNDRFTWKPQHSELPITLGSQSVSGRASMRFLKAGRLAGALNPACVLPSVAVC